MHYSYPSCDPRGPEKAHYIDPDYNASFTHDQLPVSSNIGRGPRGAGVGAELVPDGYGGFVFRIYNLETGESVIQSPDLSAGNITIKTMEHAPVAGEPAYFYVQVSKHGQTTSYKVDLPSGNDGTRIFTYKDIVPFSELDVYVFSIEDIEYDSNANYRSKPVPRVNDFVMFTTSKLVDGVVQYSLAVAHVNAIENDNVITSCRTYVPVTTPHIGSNGNWFIDEYDTNVEARGPQGIQGIPGVSVIIQDGLYQNPDSPTPDPSHPPLPAFADTEEGHAYLVDDISVAGQFDLYIHGAGGTDWTIVDNWGGIPGQKGDPGPAGSISSYYGSLSFDDDDEIWNATVYNLDEDVELTEGMLLVLEIKNANTSFDNFREIRVNSRPIESIKNLKNFKEGETLILVYTGSDWNLVDITPYDSNIIFAETLTPAGDEVKVLQRLLENEKFEYRKDNPKMLYVRFNEGNTNINMSFLHNTNGSTAVITNHNNDYINDIERFEIVLFLQTSSTTFEPVRRSTKSTIYDMSAISSTNYRYIVTTNDKFTGTDADVGRRIKVKIGLVGNTSVGALLNVNNTGPKVVTVYEAYSEFDIYGPGQIVTSNNPVPSNLLLSGRVLELQYVKEGTVYYWVILNVTDINRQFHFLMGRALPGYLSDYQKKLSYIVPTSRDVHSDVPFAFILGGMIIDPFTRQLQRDGGIVVWNIKSLDGLPAGWPPFPSTGVFVQLTAQWGNLYNDEDLELREKIYVHLSALDDFGNKMTNTAVGTLNSYEEYDFVLGPWL